MYFEKSKGLLESRKIYAGLTAAGIVSAVLVLFFSFTVDISEPHWEKEKLANSSVGFVQLEVGEDAVHVAHRNSGVEYFRKQRGTLESFKPGEWKREKVDGRENAGSYISMDLIGGNPMIAYQYAEIAEEEVRLAERKNGNWSRSSNLAEASGLNVGVHTEVAEFQNNPLVFYTDDRNENLVMVDGSGNRKQLESGAGLATGAENCGGKVYAAYADRGTNNLNLGTYDGSWQKRELNVSATALDLEMKEGCEPLVVYHSDSDDRVKVWENGETRNLEKSQFTRISADLGEELELLYTRRNVGLRHKIEGGSDVLLEENRDSGNYHDLEIENGNRYAAYTNGSELVYAEYSTSEPEIKKKALDAARTASALLAVLLVLVAYWKDIFPLQRLFDFLTQKL